jgi:DNA-binding SARP family transcriptional activator
MARGTRSAYRAALPLWRGEPYGEVVEASWVVAERARLAGRYLEAAIRAGELLFASGDLDGARDAARRAIAAEPSQERAYRVLARVHLAADDIPGAARVVDECRTALAALGLAPARATLDLVADSARST